MTYLRARRQRPRSFVSQTAGWAVACTVLSFSALLLLVPLGAPTARAQAPESNGKTETETKTETMPESDGEAASASTYRAVTSDPTISPERLALAVKPLTLSQLKVEVDAWQKRVQEIATQIADQQAAVITMKEGEASDDDASKQESAIQAIIELKAEQTERLEQFQIVLDSYDRKGGEVEVFTKYIAAQRGVDLKSADAQMVWHSIRGWLTSEQGGWMWGRRLLAFFIILLAARIATGIVTSLVHRWLRRSSRLSKLAESLISRSIRHALMLLGFMVALTALGIDVGPLLAAVGATGFIVGFALQGTLSNFASGLMILVNRPFDVGDAVEAGGVTGTVSAMSLVSTTFMSFDNQKIIVPNNEIWGNVITNITASETRRVDLTFGVGYGDDLERVRRILEEESSQHPNVLEVPAPVVKMHELGDSAVKFICRPWAKTADYWTVYWDLLTTVKKRFDEEGISLPYPQREVHLRTPSDDFGRDRSADSP